MVLEQDFKNILIETFFLNPKNCYFSVGDSGKIVGAIEKLRPKVTSKFRNVQKKCFWLSSEGG